MIQNIKEFFEDLIMLIKLILFSGSVTLTPGYVSLQKNEPFVYEKKLNVLNSNAAVKIDISKSTVKEKIGIHSITDPQFDKKLHNFIKKCPVKIYAIYKNKKIYFKKPYISWGGYDNVSLNFNSDGLDGVAYIQKLHIVSACPLDNVKIYWINGME